MTPFVIWEGGFIARYPTEKLLPIFTIEWRFPTQEKIRGYTNTPHVNLLIVRLSIDYLWCCIFRVFRVSPEDDKQCEDTKITTFQILEKELQSYQQRKVSHTD